MNQKPSSVTSDAQNNIGGELLATTQAEEVELALPSDNEESDNISGDTDSDSTSADDEDGLNTGSSHRRRIASLRHMSKSSGEKERRVSQLLEDLKVSECVFDVSIIDVMHFKYWNLADRKIDTSRGDQVKAGSIGKYERSNSVQDGNLQWDFAVFVENTLIPSDSRDLDGSVRFLIPAEMLNLQHHVSLRLSRKTSKGRTQRLQCRLPLQGSKASSSVRQWYVAHTKSGRPKRKVLISHKLSFQNGKLNKSISIPKLIVFEDVVPVSTKVHSALFKLSQPPDLAEIASEKTPSTKKQLSYMPNPNKEEIISMYAGVGSLVEKPSACEELVVFDVGTIILTSFRILHIPYKGDSKNSVQHYSERILQIPVGLVDELSRIHSHDLPRPCPEGWILVIKCRNGQSFLFFLGDEKMSTTGTASTVQSKGSNGRGVGCCGMNLRNSIESELEENIENMLEELELEITWLSKEQLSKVVTRDSSLENGQSTEGVAKRFRKELHGLESHSSQAKKAAFSKKRRGKGINKTRASTTVVANAEKESVTNGTVSPSVDSCWSRELLENPMGDFERLECFKNGWRITKANYRYKLCSSYSRQLVVPDELSDDHLYSAATYRSRNRLPILSWRSTASITSGSMAVMCRCSQPMTGISGKTSKKDEMLLYALCQHGSQADINFEKGEIDTKEKQVLASKKSHFLWNYDGAEAGMFWDRSLINAKDREGGIGETVASDSGSENENDDVFTEAHVMKHLDGVEAKTRADGTIPHIDLETGNAKETKKSRKEAEADSIPSDYTWDTDTDSMVQTKRHRFSTVKMENGLIPKMLHKSESSLPWSRQFRSFSGKSDPKHSSSTASMDQHKSLDNFTALEFTGHFAGSRLIKAQLSHDVENAADEGEGSGSNVSASVKGHTSSTSSDIGNQKSSLGNMINSLRASSMNRKVVQSNSLSTSNSLLIADARPKINAIANKLKGKGYENTSSYKKENIELKFFGIGNIHVMRNSQRKILGSIESGDWHSHVERSNWLSHIQRVLASACRVAAKIASNQSVLVHCSDGWDRTSQITSLSCLLLDPFYRTLPGFCVLVQREWLLAGHKFEDRTGFFSEKESSPVFLQFLDCCWQIFRQNSSYFGFNEDLLQFLAIHAYSRWFPDFCYNSDRERQEFLWAETSIWSFIEAQEECFTNPSFARNLSKTAKNDEFSDRFAGSGVKLKNKDTSDGTVLEPLSLDSTERELETEVLKVNCMNVIFWQEFYRYGFLPFDMSNGKEMSLRRSADQCRVQRFDPIKKNVLAALQGYHPGQKDYSPDKSGSTSETSSGNKASPGKPQSRARRLSVLETLKDVNLQATDDFDTDVDSTKGPAGYCTVQ